MTIALGLLCEGGAIIAADTQIVDTNGMITQGYKVFHFTGRKATFAIANASNDANAAVTMIRKIQAALEGTEFKNWKDVEEVIAYEMSDFSQPFKTSPEHQLIVAGFLKDNGVRLYFCEPPNTVLPKMLEAYASAGGGASVSDPLYHTLFEFTGHLSPQLILRQIAYLMYRAKKDHALCGGDTTAFYICEDMRDPEAIALPCFVKAEKRMQQLDHLLGRTAQIVLGETKDLKTDSDNLALSIVMSTPLRDVVFHNSQLDPIQAPIARTQG
ncbi:MAG: hypothetical protein ACHQT6_01845 [Candidatus Acidiferrales bacterium]